MSIAEQVSAKFNFSVDKFPLSGPDNMKTPLYGLFRSDTNQLVGSSSVTDRYVPHTVDDVVALCDAVEQVFDGEVHAKCHFRDGHYVIVEPTKEQRRAVFGTADNIFPRLMIRAGYDGMAFSASMGYYRDLCKNMHIMRSVKSTSVSIRHTSNLRSNMDELIQTFGLLKESWMSLGDLIDRLEATKVNMVDFLDQLYGQPENSARAITIHKNRTSDIFSRLSREQMISGRTPMSQSNGWQVTGWEAFNGIQGFVQHDAQSKKEFAGEFDRIIRASKDANVIQAEKLLLSLSA